MTAQILSASSQNDSYDSDRDISAFRSTVVKCRTRSDYSDDEYDEDEELRKR